MWKTHTHSRTACPARTSCIMTKPMDMRTVTVTSPATAIQVGELGGAGVLNLEGLWTRYEDPEPVFEEIAARFRKSGKGPSGVSA